MSEVKLIDIVEFYKVIKVFQDKKIPISTAYKLYNFISLLEKDVTFYEESLKEILEEYAEKNEDGSFKTNKDQTQIILKENCIDDCNTKINELANCEKKINLPTLTIDDFNDFELSIKDISILKPFLKEN